MGIWKFIYAYCIDEVYDGYNPYANSNANTRYYIKNKKTSQCFLGFAPYTVDADGHVHLLTKFEFRDKEGNSFGDFTQCSRIISMDIRDGHLWITFLYHTNSPEHCYKYSYFYIKAKDLVGE